MVVQMSLLNLIGLLPWTVVISLLILVFRGITGKWVNRGSVLFSLMWIIIIGVAVYRGH
jgi:hypothetical protein